MSTQITVRFDITTEAIKAAFPTATNITLNASGKTATVEFADANDAKASSSIAAFHCPISQRPQVVYCKPDVTTQAVDASNLVTYADVQTKSGGRVYKNQAELDTKHVASLKFTPLVNSVILAPMDFGVVQIQVASIIVSPEQDGRVSVFMRVFHKDSGRSGTCILKRSVDDNGQVKYSRRCFDLLVNKDDYKQDNEAIVPINFISIESINLDPTTGLWSELKISLDKVEAKLSTFRLGAVAPKRILDARRGNQQPPQQFGRHFAPRSGPGPDQQRRQQQPAPRRFGTPGARPMGRSAPRRQTARAPRAPQQKPVA